ncbi:hypothetical protein ETAA8_11860 [Anatilimnocola aggregata]|uniref:Uncharacterized protein n=1 Tax=Anatilimnocola aggregata TaxID=2528021 RepID=A0A517Y7J9_9BACT|nr:hypothetical protein ETAA8_11860 [Anatilimnocola aggregata]
MAQVPQEPPKRYLRPVSLNPTGQETNSGEKLLIGRTGHTTHIQPESASYNALSPRKSGDGPKRIAHLTSAAETVKAKCWLVGDPVMTVPGSGIRTPIRT